MEVVPCGCSPPPANGSQLLRGAEALTKTLCAAVSPHHSKSKKPSGLRKHRYANIKANSRAGYMYFLRDCALVTH